MVSSGGTLRRAAWSDSQHVAASVVTAHGLRLAEVDVRTGAQRNVLELPDSVLTDFAALPNGWVWIPPARDRIVVSEAGRRREFPLPQWFAGSYQLAADRARHRVFYVGFGRAANDSASIGLLTLDDGKQTIWATHFAEGAQIASITAHQALFSVATTQDSWSLFALDGPGQVTPLGTIGRPIRNLSVSADLARATIMVLDYRADAWLNRVVVR
jgi:hypothetical protein